MRALFTTQRSRRLAALREAIDRSQCIIEFDTNGYILEANGNFLAAFGYSLEEVVGKHHRMFVRASAQYTDDYKRFWASLARGEFQSGVFRRVDRSGRDVWIRASYNPVLDGDGRVQRVVKLASDITETMHRNADLAGQVAAIGRTQAVIEFNPKGEILAANDIFLAAMGYSLEEIQGKHHRMFMPPEERNSPEYHKFWGRLAAGEFFGGEFKRVSRNGDDVWIQASYTPILDEDGQVIKVVKFASDITEQKRLTVDAASQLEAISKSQAVIEFSMDGIVMTANDNFLAVMGYRLDEIRGQHHSLFMAPAERETADYHNLWQKLKKGDYQAGEFRRIGKGGRDVWIQASYNPIVGLDGKPYKVVKYASDVTRQVLARQRSEYVRDMMESVAAGAEEMNASIREIADSMRKSRDEAEAANQRVDEAGTVTGRLTSLSDSMVEIVSLITGITGQINLLALNASIEAARAGEAGKGFAVVAQEVKNLATQARTATDRIAEDIGGLRATAGEVVATLGTIHEAIGQVNDYVSSIAVAVEQQSAVAGEMSANMNRAAQEAARIGA
ncbi:PAS domain-containing methyl-accepting chemotaxis protein [Niveispirillum sp.]|uniref:methyl-accepting chemotaxis protein n=1 Tax=Niveispirillum sp. TaxID=1917217 RepID=UPI001B641E5E|nr:PAS domain-containing methyl-accepting chemotaxis protein [Niveispirillum sp.]MBP7339513.1 PAS domain-containing methyl-accepting chemotaxis protein [Niveispirillum sp.]